MGFGEESLDPSPVFHGADVSTLSLGYQDLIILSATKIARMITRITRMIRR